MKSENITLFFSQGSSDKVYTARLIEDGDGWVVNFAYGRRGKPMVNKTKTATPVSYEEAKKIYDKLVAGKKAKGYTEDEGGVAYSATPVAEEVTGLLPQLLNPIAEEDWAAMLHNWSFICFQVKYDGENRPVSVEPGGPVIAANRRGLRVSLPLEVENALQKLSEALEGKLILATEDMGSYLVVYDVLHLKTDLTNVGFATRANQIAYLQETALDIGPEVTKHLSFELATNVMNMTALEQWVDAARRNNEEGVVFKDPDASFSVGRPNSGGPALKFKFVESATCRVIQPNKGKRSVQLGVTDENGALLFIGNVTIPANYEIPNAGDLVEIEYLYAYPDGGSLYQPQYKGVRSDKTAADEYETLKFKG